MAYTLQPASEPRQRAPRKRDEKHLAFLRTLPCAIPGCFRQDIHAAHLRGPCLVYGKRATGMAEKPSDCWTVPLCSDHHLFGEGSQHSMGEDEFYEMHGIDPFLLAKQLYEVTGNWGRAARILRQVKAT